MYDYAQLVDREHLLCPHYIPNDLKLVNVPFPCQVPTDDLRRFLKKEAAVYVQEMFKAAAKEKISLFAISGFRSYKRQSVLYQRNPNGAVAFPGASEHQLGLALDVSTPDVALELTEEFEFTQAGKWVAAYGPLYGFILRYPKKKTSITGIPYEPWHLRYVTKNLALYLTLTGMTLDEYHIHFSKKKE